MAKVAQNCTLTMLLTIISLIVVPVFTEDYCEITCKNKKHTMCLFSSPSEACVKIEYTDSKAVNQGMLKMHNEFRNQMANEKFRKQKDRDFPKAANMRQMYWDKELETIAKRWAEQCDFAHDGCRNVKRFHVGQNLGKKSISLGSGMPPKTSSASFMDWVKEIEDTDGSILKGYKTGDKMIGHFTQAGWAESYLLGCAEVLFDDTKKNWRTRHIVCNYGPAGNVNGQPMYIEGEPCSKCADGLKCGTTYKYLCSDPKRVDDEVPSSASLKRISTKLIYLLSLYAIVFPYKNIPHLLVQ